MEKKLPTLFFLHLYSVLRLIKSAESNSGCRSLPIEGSNIAFGGSYVSFLLSSPTMDLEYENTNKKMKTKDQNFVQVVRIKDHEKQKMKVERKYEI